MVAYFNPVSNHIVYLFAEIYPIYCDIEHCYTNICIRYERFGANSEDNDV